MLVGVPGNKNGIDPFLIGTPEVTVKKFGQYVDEEKYELRSSSRYSLENGNELGSRPQIGGRCGDSADGIANRVCNPKPMQPARAPCSLREPHAACESPMQPARALCSLREHCAVRSDRIREF